MMWESLIRACGGNTGKIVMILVYNILQVLAVVNGGSATAHAWKDLVNPTPSWKDVPKIVTNLTSELPDANKTARSATTLTHVSATISLHVSQSGVSAAAGTPLSASFSASTIHTIVHSETKLTYTSLSTSTEVADKSRLTDISHTAKQSTTTLSTVSSTKLIPTLSSTSSHKITITSITSPAISPTSAATAATPTTMSPTTGPRNTTTSITSPTISPTSAVTTATPTTMSPTTGPRNTTTSITSPAISPTSAATTATPTTMSPTTGPRNTTRPNTTMSKAKRAKNLVILYATVFSVVGFVVVVIICVVVNGCRKTGLNTSFTFNKQLDQELGTFQDIPRAKKRPSEINSEPPLHVVNEKHMVNGNGGPFIDELSERVSEVRVDNDGDLVDDDYVKVTDKSIENKGYIDDEGRLDSDSSSTM